MTEGYEADLILGDEGRLGCLGGGDWRDLVDWNSLGLVGLPVEIWIKDQR